MDRSVKALLCVLISFGLMAYLLLLPSFAHSTERHYFSVGPTLEVGGGLLLPPDLFSDDPAVPDKQDQNTAESSGPPCVPFEVFISRMHQEGKRLKEYGEVDPETTTWMQMYENLDHDWTVITIDKEGSACVFGEGKFLTKITEKIY